jgi:hypothetical protein
MQSERFVVSSVWTPRTGLRYQPARQIRLRRTKQSKRTPIEPDWQRAAESWMTRRPGKKSAEQSRRTKVFLNR